MKTVVAGGGGFIGSNLCRRLLHEGRQVVCIDNFVTGRHSNIDSLQDYPAFELIEADIIEGDLPDLGPLDEVYNLASPASPPGYQQKALQTLRVNSEGTRHLLDLAARGGARFVYASTDLPPVFIPLGELVFHP
ncbi:MAG: NAD-dependent epimerase/dehydratase family protein [Chloroflexota bacterium]